MLTVNSLVHRAETIYDKGIKVLPKELEQYHLLLVCLMIWLLTVHLSYYPFLASELLLPRWFS